MAHGGHQLDSRVYQNLRQKFPEIPEGVLSECILQNHNNAAASEEALTQQSSRYLYGEVEGEGIGVPPELHTHTIHLNLGNGSSRIRLANNVPHGTTSSLALSRQPVTFSDGRDGGGFVLGKAYPSHTLSQNQQQCSPFTVTLKQAPSGRNTPTSLHIRNVLPSMGTPKSLHIHGLASPTILGENTLYLGPSTAMSSAPSVMVQRPGASQTRPVSLIPPPGHQTSHVFMPVTSPTAIAAHVQIPTSQVDGPAVMTLAGCDGSNSNIYSSGTVAGFGGSGRKNQIEIKIEQQQQQQQQQQQHHNTSHQQIRGGHGHVVTTTQGNWWSVNQPTMIITSPSVQSLRSISGLLGNGTASGNGDLAPQTYAQPALIRHQPPRSRPTSIGPVAQSTSVSPARVVVTQPNTKYTFNITVSPNKPPAISPGIASPTYESPSVLEALERHAESEEMSKGKLFGSQVTGEGTSTLVGPGSEKTSGMYPLKSSHGSDDQAYTQALLEHQRMRRKRLEEELDKRSATLQDLKKEVNEMEMKLEQRRLQRASSAQTPSLEEMKRLREKNLQLQIDIDCMTKEIDLRAARGSNFNPANIDNFYRNLYSGQQGPLATPIQGREKQENPSNEDEEEGVQWSCKACTFLNHPALNRCEQCEMPRYYEG